MPTNAAGWRIDPPVSVPVDPRRHPRRDRRRRPARASARGQRRIAAVVALPRRNHRAVGAGLVRRSHREFVHVELAQHPRARGLQLARDGAFVGRLEALQDVRSGRRLATPSVQNRSLIPSGMPDSGFNSPPALAASAASAAASASSGVSTVHAFSARPATTAALKPRRNLARRKFAATKAVAKLGNGLVGKLGHYSITLGTAKNPCCASGALSRTASRTPPSIDHIVAQPQFQVDHRGQRLDPVGVHLAKLLDPAEDIVEFGHHLVDLGIAQREPGELGDMAHFFFGDRHRVPDALDRQAIQRRG